MSVPMIFPDDTARARRSDPVESHEAADRADTAASRRAVLAILADGPLSDEQVHARQSVFTPERMRTARKELERQGRVVEAGEGVTSKGRRCKTWTLA